MKATPAAAAAAAPAVPAAAASAAAPAVSSPGVVVTFEGRVIARCSAGTPVAAVILAFETSWFGPIRGVRDTRGVLLSRECVLLAAGSYEAVRVWRDPCAEIVSDGAVLVQFVVGACTTVAEVIDFLGRAGRLPSGGRAVCGGDGMLLSGADRLPEGRFALVRTSFWTGAATPQVLVICEGKLLQQYPVGHSIDAVRKNLVSEFGAIHGLRDANGMLLVESHSLAVGIYGAVSPSSAAAVQATSRGVVYEFPPGLTSRDILVRAGANPNLDSLANEQNVLYVGDVKLSEGKYTFAPGKHVLIKPGNDGTSFWERLQAWTRPAPAAAAAAAPAPTPSASSSSFASRSVNTPSQSFELQSVPEESDSDSGEADSEEGLRRRLVDSVEREQYTEYSDVSSAGR